LLDNILAEEEPNDSILAGCVSVATTHVYGDIDLEMKARALEKCSTAVVKTPTLNAEGKSMTFLRASPNHHLMWSLQQHRLVSDVVIRSGDHKSTEEIMRVMLAAGPHT
jgi:hypothetical protein